MTQEPGLRPSPSSIKRSTRAGRNRPVLVTSAENELQENGSMSEPATDELTTPVKEIATEALAPAAPRRRLPGFFSTVGKTTEAAASKTADVAEARIARATRGKAASSTSSASSKTLNEVEKPSKSEEKKEPTSKTVAAPARPQRPPSPFKTKYLLGMGLYLVGADLFGVVESNFFASNHLDSVLTTFNLFSLPFVIKTSTIVYLVTLVVVLVLLARFDLIPRSFGAARSKPVSTSNKSGANNRSTNQQNNTSNMARVSPPTLKRGVKGGDDDLYQEYRSNQRRGRKK
jgi:hypothetical protein